MTAAAVALRLIPAIDMVNAMFFIIVFILYIYPSLKVYFIYAMI
jgi:hypothetical protein